MGAYGEGASGVFGVTELGGGGGYAKGRTFYLHEIGDLERIVRERLAGRRPYVPEPALAGLAEAWARITGTPPPGGAGDEDPGQPGGGLARAADPGEDHDDDLPAAAGRAARYDADGTRAKVAAARAAGTEPVSIPPIPPGMEAHAAAVLAERQRQFLAAYTDVALPEADQMKLRAMLARPGGVSAREAAQQGLSCGRTKVNQQLKRWEQERTVEMTGKGSKRTWHAATPDGYPPLRAVPGTAPAVGHRGPAAPAAGPPVTPLSNRPLDAEPTGKRREAGPS